VKKLLAAKGSGLGKVLFATLTLVSTAAGAQTAHPLDGLTMTEHWKIFEALKESGRVDRDTRYPQILLNEPPKAEVMQWKQGEPFRREALVVVKQRKQTFEAVVDIPNQRIISWNEVKGVQPNLTREEIGQISGKIKENKEWLEAIRRRGISDLETVECVGLSPGYFGTPEEQGRRLQRVICNERRGTRNADARPISGLVVVWDTDESKALRVIDTGAVPVSNAPADFDASSVGALREAPAPLRIEQPQGPGFRIEGYEVSWQKWQFHFRIDARSGVIVDHVRYNDGGRPRPVLYEGSLSEIFVPYMDPSEGWYHWTYMDLGEYSQAGLGLAKSLERDVDCPENAVYFDAVSADAQAIPVLHRRVACLFERDAGNFAWRHRVGPNEVQSRRRRDLVLRMIATLGNYDYAFDWSFMQDGAIQVAVGATGIDQVKAVKSRTATDDHGGKDGAYGHFIAENTVGINHDHYFSFRLDLDVDGAANTLVRDKMKQQLLPADHPRRSLWVVESEPAHREQDAQLHMSMEHPEVWRVVNPSVKSPLGYPVSYEIKPGHNVMTLLSADDMPRKRAGFIDHHLWVTPQRDNERWAAGAYPTQSKGGDGLPSWTSANRPIENTDIVVWYTVGFHHIPRPEDFPVMPAAWHEFMLRPVDFFSRNPALDLPEP
jgi:primary-amine oxidase